MRLGPQISECTISKACLDLVLTLLWKDVRTCLPSWHDSQSRDFKCESCGTNTMMNDIWRCKNIAYSWWRWFKVIETLLFRVCSNFISCTLAFYKERTRVCSNFISCTLAFYKERTRSKCYGTIERTNKLTDWNQIEGAARHK